MILVDLIQIYVNTLEEIYLECCSGVFFFSLTRVMP